MREDEEIGDIDFVALEAREIWEIFEYFGVGNEAVGDVREVCEVGEGTPGQRDLRDFEKGEVGQNDLRREIPEGQGGEGRQVSHVLHNAAVPPVFVEFRDGHFFLRDEEGGHRMGAVEAVGIIE